MATNSNDGSGLNLSNGTVKGSKGSFNKGVHVKPSRGKSTKSFSKSPNPADVGGLGNTAREPALTNPVSDNKALSEEALREFFTTVFQIADNTRRPRELIWHQCWDVYNGVYDWSAKSWWQSRANIPKVRSSVDRAVSIFRKSLLRLRQFYQVAGDTKRGKLKGQFTSALLDYWLDQVGSLDELVTGFKVGLITSTVVMKIWWQQTREYMPDIIQTEEPETKFGVEIGTKTKQSVEFKEKKKGKFAARACDPFNIWIVPKTNRFAVIERTYATFDEICTLAEEGIYDEKQLDRIENYTGPQTVKKSQEARRAGEMPTSPDRYLREIELYHYWGDIYNKEGRIVMPNARFTMVGKEVLIGKARPNPFFHKKPPYVIGSPYTVPFSMYNRGMVEDVYEIAKSITELSNVIFDGAMYDALKAFALDIDQLDDPSEANNGVYPGKTFIKKSSQAAPGAKLIETIDVGKIPQEAMNALTLFKQAFQEGTYVNEWVEGQGGKGDRTLGEVNIKTQSALEGLDEAARNIEIGVIEPFLELASKTIYQFHKDYSIPRLADEFPQAAQMLQDLSPAERYAIMVGGYEFKARGLSVLIDQQQRIGEITNFLQLLANIPGLMERINPDELLEAIMLPLNWNVERLLIGRQPGAMPATPVSGTPTGQGAVTPAQQMAAKAGAQAGGARNNPMSPGGVGAQQNRGAPMQGLMRMVMQGNMAGRR